MFKGSTKSYLVYAVVLAVLAAAAAAWYVASAEAAANPTVPVVVARTEIPGRAVLSEDMVTLRKLPRGAVHPEASTNMALFIGKTAKQRIAPGEQVLASKLFKDRVESGLTYVVPEGHRAVALSVNELIAAGGLVAPGDRVDILVSCLVAPQEKREQYTRTVYSLQNVQVLAVAQAIQGEEGASPVDALKSQNPQNLLNMPAQPSTRPMAKTMTLSLPPEDAQRLVMLENHPSCHLRLALRAAADNARLKIGVLDFDPAVSMDPVAKP